ncbi:hypothetical protein BGX31_006764, partial [Mortierella sp. GBA43]
MTALKSVRAFSTSWSSFLSKSGSSSAGATAETGVEAGAGATVAKDRTSRPFRVAVIGSGPGGFYTSHRILKN